MSEPGGTRFTESCFRRGAGAIHSGRSLAPDEPRVKIENCTPMRLDPKPIIRFVEALGFAGPLPAAMREPKRFLTRELLVRILPDAKDVPQAHYCCGRILISACPYCTTAHVVWCLLYELFDVWLESYCREWFDRDDEPARMRFANRAFGILGGTIANQMDCTTYQLPADTFVRWTEPKVIERVRRLLPRGMPTLVP